MHYSLTRATMWNFAGYGYLILASFVSTPILIHSLSLSLFAKYGLIIATLTLVSSIDIGLPRSVVRALVQAHNNFAKRQTIWATSSVLFIVTGLLAGIVAVVLSLPLNLTLYASLLIFFIALLSNITAHYQTLPQAEGHFGYYNSKTFIVGTANTILAAFLAHAGYGIEAILSSQLFCYLLTLIPYAYFSLKFFPNPRTGVFSISQAHLLLKFGIKNQIGKLVGQIQAQYGKYLLSSFAPIQLTSYIVATNLVQKLAGGVGQLSSALYPASSRGNIRHIYHRLQFMLVIISILGYLGFRFLGLEFLEWWLKSKELVIAVNQILEILVPYFAILVLTPLPSTILDGLGSPELTSLFAFATTLIEITFALLLLPTQGFLAPVYAPLIAVAITTPALLYITECSFNKVKSTS